MVYIAILGLGTVGSGVAEVMTKNANSIARRAGDEIAIKYIYSRRERPDTDFNHLITNDFEQILNDPEITVVVEAMGGLTPAYDYTKRLLLAGKHVVTPNKELVATYGHELLNIAREKNLNYLFEASVGGGIPLISPMNQCLTANEVTAVTGILNGTTNYILSQMISHGKSFDEALKVAKEKGYAEADPTADVAGFDACRKIAILASLIFNQQVDYKEIHTEGIENITLKDVEYAKEGGYAIKLLGRARLLDSGKIFAMVSPCLVPMSSQLANVEDIYNGILVEGDAIGEVMFYGKGAGKLPTASAVSADVIDAVKHRDKRIWYYFGPKTENFVEDFKKVPVIMCVRVKCDKHSSALEAAAKVFNEEPESIILPKNENEIAFIMPKMEEGILEEKLGKLLENPGISEIVSKIRVMEEPEGI